MSRDKQRCHCPRSKNLSLIQAAEKTPLIRPIRSIWYRELWVDERLSGLPHYIGGRKDPQWGLFAREMQKSSNVEAQSHGMIFPGRSAASKLDFVKNCYYREATFAVPLGFFSFSIQGYSVRIRLKPPVV